MYKTLPFSVKTWRKIGVEVIKYNDKNWINEKHVKTALGYNNLFDNKTQYYFDKFKKKNT